MDEKVYYDRIGGLLDNNSDFDRIGRLYVVGGAACVALSVVLFLINTRHGIGIFVDSTRYMGISERPYDAPLYPWLLRLAVMAGLTMDGGAKVIGLFFAAANTALVWHLLARSTGKFAYALGGTLLVILAPQFVTLHSLAMSEPPFLFFLLVTLLLLLRYLESEKTLWLVASAIALGLATLTRFTAPPMGAAIALGLLLNPRYPVPRRIRDAVLFGLVSAAIFFCWTAVSQITAGHSIGRDLWLYGNMGRKEWLTSLEALTAWLLPDQFPFAVRVVVFALFFVCGAALTSTQARNALRQAREDKAVDALLPLILALFFVFYLGFMALSTSIEANLSLNGRYAFPAYVSTVLLMTIVTAQFSNARGVARLLHHGLVCLAILVIGAHASRAAVRSLAAFQSGVGYASLTWQNSPTIEALRKMPADAVIYSNGADAIAYLLKRPAHFIPERVQLRTGVDNPAKPYEKQLDELRGGGLSGDTAYLVIFDNVDWRFYLASEEELKARLSLALVASEPDGRIYSIPKPTPSEQ